MQATFVDKENRPALAETGVKVLYDDQAVYFGFVCADRDIKALKASNSFSWSDDCLAIFLQPDETAPVYHQLGCNTRGLQFHQKVVGGDKDYAALPGWKAAATVEGDCWTAEVRVPYTTFGMKDRGTGRWRINVHRVVRDGLVEPSSWAFSGSNWHDIGKLGRLEFD